jgi:WS/DGAT/MGAT family acyltransferase
MWMVEADPLLRSTILGVAVLEGPPDWHRVQARVEAASHQVPALREKVVPVPLHPTTLRWVRDHDFDLRYHLRHIRLPEDSSLQDLLDWVRTEAMRGFDTARPLWEFTLVEGLASGQAAFVMKAHHVVTDGIGAVQLSANLFDFEPQPPAHPPAVPTGAPHVNSYEMLRDALAHDVEGLVDFTRHQLGSAVPNLLHAIRHPQHTVTQAIETATSIGRILAPATTPKSPVMVDRMLSENFRVLEVPMAAMRAAGKATGARLNDSFLAGITAGLDRYHAHHGRRVHELRVAMPISHRGEEDPAGGNHLSVMRFVVPVDSATPAERIAAMHTAVERIRAERSLDHTEAIAGFLNLMPKGVIGAMLRGVDFLASNVPGVPVPLWLEGRRVQRIYPFGPSVGSAVNITLMSYDGTCGIGVNADAAAIPDPDVLIDCLRAGFAEVCAVAA